MVPRYRADLLSNIAHADASVQHVSAVTRGSTGNIYLDDDTLHISVYPAGDQDERIVAALLVHDCQVEGDGDAGDQRERCETFRYSRVYGEHIELLKPIELDAQ